MLYFKKAAVPMHVFLTSEAMGLKIPHFVHDDNVEVFRMTVRGAQCQIPKHSHMLIYETYIKKELTDCNLILYKL